MIMLESSVNGKDLGRATRAVSMGDGVTHWAMHNDTEDED